MYNAVRSASCLTKEECHFWALDRNTFKKVLQDLVSGEFE
jgi:CRP-like cAMP-binding protein